MELRLVASEGLGRGRVYAAGVLCAIGGTLLRIPFASILKDKVPYITFFLATAVSATYGGLASGLVTTGLGALLAALYVVRWPGSPTLGNSGDYLGLVIFLAVSSFISYLAEKRLDATRRENALRVLFQQTVLSIGDAVITTDDRKRIRLMNPVAEALTGWSQAEAMGRPVEEVFRIENEHSKAPAEVPIDRILKTGEVVGLANHTELVTRSGTRIPIDDSGAPIRTQNGQVVGAVLVFRDISQKRQSEAKVEALNEELRQFTYAATHDISEPLRTISILLQLIDRDLAGKTDSDTAGHLFHAQEATQRLTHLLDSLLQLAVMRDTHDNTVEAGPVDAESALQEALRNLEAAFQDSGGAITHSLLPKVQVNFVHLCQLLQNLIGNALKYRRPGVPPEIHINATAEGTYWTFSVRDNGTGIAPENYAGIFVPFKRFHSYEVRGAGIGLAICKRIVERYGGRIWVAANDGPGATFFFSLPGAKEL